MLTRHLLSERSRGDAHQRLEVCRSHVMGLNHFPPALVLAPSREFWNFLDNTQGNFTAEPISKLMQLPAEKHPKLAVGLRRVAHCPPPWGARLAPLPHLPGGAPAGAGHRAAQHVHPRLLDFPDGDLPFRLARPAQHVSVLR